MVVYSWGHMSRHYATVVLCAVAVMFACDDSSTSYNDDVAIDSGADDGGDAVSDIEDADAIDQDPSVDASSGVRIVGATLSSSVEHIERFGDSFMTTWADDGATYLTFGDGTGLRDCYPVFGAPPDPPTCDVVPTCDEVDACILEWLYCEVFTVPCGSGYCYEACRITDLGLLRFEGEPPAFDACTPFDSCIVARNIPSGREFFDDAGINPVDRNDKPSSMLFVDGRLILAGHSPALYAEEGWLAYSEDYGVSWTEVPGSPWKADSPFRVLMFFNMGRAYEWAQDDNIYALGIGWEAGWTTEPTHHGRPDAEDKTVYLARVARSSVLDYDAWEYLSGYDEGGAPIWSDSQADAVVLPELETQETGSPIYHPWTDRYLFLTAGPGALWQAPEPWGPWSKVSDLFHEASDGTWASEGYLPSIITRGVGEDYLTFAISGNVAGYYLRIHRLDLDLQTAE